MENVTEWPYRKVLKLIALFRQRPVLWDTRCDAYKDQQKRDEAMYELAAHFNVAKDEIERKLRNLQNNFYREVKKEAYSKSAGTGMTDIYRSKWYAYQVLRFLTERSKLKQTQAAASSNTSIARLELGAPRVVMTKLDDENRLKKSQHQVKQSALVIKNVNDKNDAAPTDLLYVDTNQQSGLDNNQMDYCNEKMISQDPIEFATQTNDETIQQSQRIVNFEANRPNEKESSNFNKQDIKVISEDVIASAMDFLVAETKAHGSNDSELNFYRSLIPDIMKLTDKRRRHLKEVVLYTLNKFLDEDESARATMK